jgi:peptide deformylase
MKRSKRRGIENIYDIVQYPSKILLRPTKGFSKFSRAADLQDFLHEATLRNKGLAVAANQVGVDASAFFMRIKDKNTFMLNPHILDTSMESVVMDEGCLSINGVLWHVRRPKDVLVQWHDINGKTIEREFDGLEARVILHEIDHLIGLSIPDYLDNELFDVFIEAYYSNLKKSQTYVEVAEEVVVKY